MTPKTRLQLLAFVTLLAMVAIACNLSIPAPTPAPTPTAVIPLPPVLVETIPPAGSQVPLNQPIAFYFNQPMDRASVEAAVSIEGEANGLFSWGDDAPWFLRPYNPCSPTAPTPSFFPPGFKPPMGWPWQNRPASPSALAIFCA
jgi:hypothetical protein